MEVLIEIADGLNELLYADVLDQNKLDQFAMTLNDMKDVCFKLVDFEKYSEEMLGRLRSEKLAFIQSQNFELAANARIEERECFKYLNFQRYFKLENSFFYPEEHKLFYFHLGTAKNDQVMRNYLFGGSLTSCA